MVVDKPAGMTSHDVVDHARRRLRTRRVGHAGTLDPAATGLLLLGVGRATRFLSYAQSARKRYRAEARFGSATTTQDASGDVVHCAPATFIRSDLERVASRFVGTIEQVPPMVSAVKVAGERLYKKARRGEEVERSARSVIVYELEVLDYKTQADVVDATLEVLCSAGTYVRTIIHDLGIELGCGAHMTALKRTEMGGFSLADAVALDELTEEDIRPLADAVRMMPRLEVDDETRLRVGHGRALDGPAYPEGTLVAILHHGELVAVYRARASKLVADRVVPT